MGNSICQELEDGVQHVFQDAFKKFPFKNSANTKFDSLTEENRNLIRLLIQDITTYPHQTMQIDIKPTATIKEFKHEITTKMGISSESFILFILNSKSLYRDEISLEDYDILNGDTLSIQARFGTNTN
eukprot:122382_1